MESEAELALHKAAENGDLQDVKNILDQGVAVDTRKDQFKKTALMKAAEKGHKEVVELLLSRGADIEAQNMMRNTALILAAKNGHKLTVEALLARRPNIETKNNHNRTALVEAAVHGHEEVVDVLAAHGADIEAKDKHELTALLEAAMYGHVKVVDVLLTLGVDIEAMNTYDGHTPLMRATSNGKEETVELLLNRGANIEATDEDGNTALMVCARNPFNQNLTGVMAKLIAHGANVSAENKAGETAMHLAKLRHWTSPVIVPMLEKALANPTVPQTNPKPKLVPVLPSKWTTGVDEKTNETIYFNTETNEQLQDPPPTFPLLQDPSYGEAIAFYDEATEEDITTDGSTIDFGNGVEVTVPEGVVPPDTSITFKTQPAFASKDVFVLPSAVEAASPTYLLSSSSDNLNGNVTLTIEHFMDLQTEEDARSLVFLVADSEPTEDSTYHFREVDTGHPVFKPGERVGTISTNHFSFWKIGWKSVKKMFLGAPSRYTFRVYRSPENSSSSVAIVFVSYLHSVYTKFLDYLDKNLVPSQYPEVSTKVIDQIIKEPLCFAGEELKIQASSPPGWSFEFDTTSIPKESADLPEELQVKPEELHSYPPKIVCRFTPTAKAPQKTTCTLTLLGLDHPVTVSIPLFSPKQAVDCLRLKDALFSLRVTIEGMHKTKLAPTAKEISSEMDDITSILSTSSSGEELAHHTQTIFDKVLGFVTSAKEVSKGATAHHISAQLQAKLPEVEKTSRNFNQIAKEKLLHCTGIAEVEKVLSDFVVTGSKLVSLIEEVVTDSERLTSIAGLDIDLVDNTTTLNEDDDSADILRELDGLESEYYTLGLHLHLPPGKVREIRENNPHNANAALGQVITQWLMMNYDYNKVGKPSWRMLVESVSTVDLERAKIIADNHKMVIEEHTPVQSENKSKAEKEKAKKNKEDVKNPPGKEDSPGPPDDGRQEQRQVKSVIETRERSKMQPTPKTNRYRQIGIAVAIVILGVGLGFFLRSRFRTRL